MSKADFHRAVEAIVERDARYSSDAFYFLLHALGHTREKLQRPACGPEGHVSGRELLEGFKEYALNQFGPMAGLVLEEWGVRRNEDVGAMVFLLVEAKQFTVTDKDKPEDFSGGADFETAFRTPFAPVGRTAGR
jgi:uncharacterized repeat protein (TIGR04138 family)